MTEQPPITLDQMIYRLPPDRREDVQRRARELIQQELDRWLDDELAKL